MRNLIEALASALGVTVVTNDGVTVAGGNNTEEPVYARSVDYDTATAAIGISDDSFEIPNEDGLSFTVSNEDILDVVPEDSNEVEYTPVLPDFHAGNLVRRAIFNDINPDLKARYVTFLNKNADLLEEFAVFAYEAKNAGFKKYSAKAIMERVRWERDLSSEGEQFKVNNSYTSLMARTLVSLVPNEFENFFEIRGKR